VFKVFLGVQVVGKHLPVDGSIRIIVISSWKILAVLRCLPKNQEIGIFIFLVDRGAGANAYLKLIVRPNL
jgi:hypothetical protein